MENLIIEPTNKTPRVNFNAISGKMELSGRSIPENAFQFYDELSRWLDDYSKTPAKETVFNFKLEYFNTSSSMYVLGILKKLERMHLEGKKITICWYYDIEDEDMLQTGEDLKQIVKEVPMQMMEMEL
ncbi:MAG: DUF1987 domain-containing protein [Thermonemataceae bacterium]|nr:DUF1987 domain-containing protein [Thermonemataceae bacterium]